jgi:dipeptidyl aminopeptidase/acylaminoacyl peptidase
VRGNYTGDVIGVVYGEGQGAIEYFDRTYAQMQADLHATFPGESVSITSVSKDRKRFIANVEGATNPGGAYYFIEGGEISLVGKEHPGLSPQDIGPVKFFTYAARDGLAIPAYLTLPNGSSGKGLPLVVMPHGGPEARDYGGFDGWAQFLASRGYAVLQPQFRGSDGFGKAFRDAGRKKWGLEMQNDITDGVKHLIANGTADGNRVAIVGWSYGGYATLAGLAFTPELYRAGVAGAPVSDLPTFYDWIQSRAGGRWFRSEDHVAQMLGNKFQDAKRLEQTSPARHADKFRAPVLLVHPDQDRTVPPEQSQIMADALKRAGKPGELMKIGGDDHYLSSPTTGREFLSRIEAFLALHMK